MQCIGMSRALWKEFLLLRLWFSTCNTSFLLVWENASNNKKNFPLKTEYIEFTVLLIIKFWKSWTFFSIKSLLLGNIVAKLQLWKTGNAMNLFRFTRQFLFLCVGRSVNLHFVRYLCDKKGSTGGRKWYIWYVYTV